MGTLTEKRQGKRAAQGAGMADAAEGQAEALGAQTGAELGGAGSASSGALPSSVRSAAERHLGGTEPRVVATFRVGHALWGKTVSEVGRAELCLPSGCLTYGDAFQMLPTDQFVLQMPSERAVAEVALGNCEDGSREVLAVLIHGSSDPSSAWELLPPEHGFGVDCGIFALVDHALSLKYMRAIGEDVDGFLGWWAAARPGGYSSWMKSGISAVMVEASDGVYMPQKIAVGGEVCGLLVPLAAHPALPSYAEDSSGQESESDVKEGAARWTR